MIIKRDCLITGKEMSQDVPVSEDSYNDWLFARKTAEEAFLGLAKKYVDYILHSYPVEDDLSDNDNE